MTAGLVTLFLGLVLMALAFVPGASVWRTLHDGLFGLFGCGSFVLGAALCYLAILYTRGEDLLPHIAKLLLGLTFASGTVIVFSDIPADLPAAAMVTACYQNGVNAWLSGGVLGALLGGNLLLLCGRPAANLVMGALALCASLYIFDVTPAEVWEWLCGVGGGVHEKGLAVYEQSAARRAERKAERLAAEAEEYEETDETDDEDALPDAAAAPDASGGIHAPGWLSGILSWGHKVTKEMEGEAGPEPPQDPNLGYEPPPPPDPAQDPGPQPRPDFEPVQFAPAGPRASFDIDLGPDHTPVKEGGSEPIEPLDLGPGGTFGMDPLRRAAPRAIVKPVVPDAVETPAEDFFVKPADAAPAQDLAVAPQDIAPAATQTPFVPGEGGGDAPRTVPEEELEPIPVSPAAQPVSAENAAAFRSAPDEDGWIRITSEPVEEKDLNTLVAAAM